MALADDQEKAKKAPQVCSHCKSIKKGCDKKLPSCSQCIKRRAICRYGEPVEPKRYGDEIASLILGKSENFTCAWASLPRPLLATLSPSIRLSLLLMNSLSDAFPSNPSGSKYPSIGSTKDSIFHSLVSHIIRQDGHLFEDITTRYFSGVHKWLPIISRKRFHQKLVQFQSIPNADFSILVLTMRLITQHPSTDPDKEQDRETLYLATKTLFTQVQTFAPASLHIIQAGIILAAYEHAHGMLEAAYVSIGACARMAFVLEMHNRQCSEEPQGTEAWLDDEESLATWWGLVICDRVIGCHPQMSGRPLATRNISDDDYLPLESDDLDELTVYSVQPAFRYFVSATSLPGVGPFGREAQAVYILDKVRMVLEVGLVNEHTLRPLGLEAQNLLSIVMEQVSGKWGIYCGATQFLITSLYILHEHAAIAADIEARTSCKAAIASALHTITRMVIDIAYHFNSECHAFNIKILCPAVKHIVRCAQQHVLMRANFEDKQWIRDFKELRKMLSFFNQRWTIAGNDLHFLESTVNMSTSLKV